MLHPFPPTFVVFALNFGVFALDRPTKVKQTLVVEGRSIDPMVPRVVPRVGRVFAKQTVELADGEFVHSDTRY